jgi:hypothetical protein
MNEDAESANLTKEMEVSDEDNPETISTIERTISTVEKAFRQHVSDEERTVHTRSGYCSELLGFVTLLARGRDWMPRSGSV